MKRIIAYALGRVNNPCDIFSTHNVLMENFSDRLKQTRRQLGMSQIELAKRAKLSQTTISDIERGRNDGSREILALASALGKTPEWLLYGKDHQPKETIVDEFTWVYHHSNKDGRMFLENAIKVVKQTFIKEEKHRNKA